MNSKRSAGFTLVEMMIVMVIASLLSLGVLQGWHAWQQRQHLQESADRMRQFLLYLRSDAGWHNRQRRLWVQTGSGWCIGSAQTPDGGEARQLCAPWSDVVLKRVTPDIGFYGRRDVAKPGSLTLGNAAGRRRIIVASRGRIRLCQPAEPECTP